MNSKATMHQGSLEPCATSPTATPYDPWPYHGGSVLHQCSSNLKLRYAVRHSTCFRQQIKPQVSQATTRRTDARRRKQASHSICRSIGGFVLSVPSFSPTYRFAGETVDELRFDREVTCRRNLQLQPPYQTHFPEPSPCHLFSTATS